MAVTRELTIVYGATTIDGSSGIHLHGDPPIRWAMRHDGGQLDFTLVVTASSAANLITASNAVIDQFRTPRQDLLVKRGGSNELDLRPSTNSAFDTLPDAVKVGDPFDTGRSQKIAVSIRFGLPANKASLAGRRESNVSVEYDSSRRRTVSIDGVYTAISGSNALAIYSGAIDAWATSVLAALGGTYKLVGPESLRYFETVKEISFARTYQELLRDLLGEDAGATVDTTADVADQILTIAVRKIGPGDSPNAAGPVLRLAEVSVSYSAAVPAGPDALDTVRDAVLAYLDAQVQLAIPDAVGLALIESTPDLNYDESRIQINQTWHAALSAGWSEYMRTERTTYESGVTLRPLWSSSRWRRYKFNRPEAMTVSVTERGLFVGKDETNARLYGTYPLTIAPAGAVWEHIGTAHGSTPLVRGVDNKTIDTVMIERVSNYEAAAPAFSLGL